MNSIDYKTSEEVNEFIKKEREIYENRKAFAENFYGNNIEALNKEIDIIKNIYLRRVEGVLQLFKRHINGAN